MLAGAEVETEHSASDIDNLLTILLEELPLKQAARLAARISGEKKNLLYQRALVLAGH
jgi:16S rRNA (cytidine1402-2'-O)-methyltransferase